MSHSNRARASLWRFLLVGAASVAGCGGAEALHDNGVDSGALAGMTGAGTGGVTDGTGGVPSGSGGLGSGGMIPVGGTTGSGGRVGSGGSVGSSGGATATGGRVGTGGSVGSSGGAGGAPAGVLFSDDFETGADGWIATNPADWSVVTDGSMVYREGATATNDWRGSAAGDSAWTNIVVEARVKILTLTPGSTTYFIAVCGRVRDANNRYCLALRSDGKIAIRKIVATSGSSSASVNVTNGIALNTWYTARFQAVGSALTGTLLLNGVQVGLVMDTDAAIPAGGIQLGTQNGTAVFDDVRVTVP